MNLANGAFLPPNLKLFFNIWNSAYSIDFYTKHLFVFPVQKDLRR